MSRKNKNNMYILGVFRGFLLNRHETDSNAFFKYGNIIKKLLHIKVGSMSEWTVMITPL